MKMSEVSGFVQFRGLFRRRGRRFHRRDSGQRNLSQKNSVQFKCGRVKIRIFEICFFLFFFFFYKIFKHFFFLIFNDSKTTSSVNKFDDFFIFQKRSFWLNFQILFLTFFGYCQELTLYYGYFLVIFLQSWVFSDFL